MRAVQIVELTGPRALRVADDVPEPVPGDDQVLVDVHAAGVSFPDLLQSRGQYQLKPELPFIPGAEVGGVVRSAPADSGFAAGDRVAAFPWFGAWAETVAVHPLCVFKLDDALDFAQGAALVVNHHTAHFVLEERGHLRAGETVLIHGAAGGVGTASIQVARGLGATTIAVVSSDEKEQVARDAGAHHVVRSDGAWKDAAREITRGRGVDVVVDPVGGDRFTDSLRALAEGGRLVVVGFTGGEIPTVKVNRLLLGNTSVVGAGWGEGLRTDPPLLGRIAARLDALVTAGHVRPVIGARYPLDRAAEALALLDGRGATGKVVLDVRPS